MDTEFIISINAFYIPLEYCELHLLFFIKPTLKMILMMTNLLK